MIGFRVNFDGTFFARVCDPVHDQPPYFLATCLLPCGPLVPLWKFTGNLEVGDANDNLSQAIHAFAHFSLKWSKGYVLLCDLQGIIELCHDAGDISCILFRVI
jgi:hypothetical protein